MLLTFSRSVLVLPKGKNINAPVEYMLINVNVAFVPFYVPASAVSPVTFVYTLNIAGVNVALLIVSRPNNAVASTVPSIVQWCLNHVNSSLCVTSLDEPFEANF